MSVTWDVREHDAIQYATEMKFPFESEALEMGDIVVKSDTETLVFERKTVADLAASIKDGRFREQKQRLLSHYPPHRITYIIEGSYKSIFRTTPFHGIDGKAYTSAILSLQYRDGCHVMVTPSIKETVSYIYEIANRVKSNPEKIAYSQANPDQETYVSSLTVKSKKGDNLTPALCYVLQLSQIPGISVKLATDISKVYPSLTVLLQAIQDKKEKALTDIEKIGPKKAKTILEYLV